METQKQKVKSARRTQRLSAARSLFAMSDGLPVLWVTGVIVGSAALRVRSQEMGTDPSVSYALAKRLPPSTDHPNTPNTA